MASASALSSPPPAATLAVRTPLSSPTPLSPVPASPASAQGWMTDLLRALQAQVQRAIIPAEEQQQQQHESGDNATESKTDLAADAAVDWDRLRLVSSRWDDAVDVMSQTMSQSEPTSVRGVLLWVVSQPLEQCIELLADAALADQNEAEAAAIAAQIPPAPPAFQAPAAHRHSWLLLSGLFDSLPRSSRSLALFGSPPRVRLDVLQQGLKDWLGLGVQHCPLPLLDMAEAKGELSTDEVYLWWSVWGSFDYRAKCSARGSASTGGAVLFLYHFQYKLLEAVRGLSGSSGGGSGGAGGAAGSSPLSCISLSHFMKALGHFWPSNAGYAGFQRAGENGFKRRLLLAESLAQATAAAAAPPGTPVPPVHPAKGLPWGEVIALLLSKDMPDTFRRLIQYKPPGLGGPGAQTPPPFSAGAGGVSGPDSGFESSDWCKRFTEDEANYAKALVTAALASNERGLRPYVEDAQAAPRPAMLNPWAPADALAAAAVAARAAAEDAPPPRIDFDALVGDMLEREARTTAPPPARLLRAIHTLRFVSHFLLQQGGSGDEQGEADPRTTSLARFTGLFLRGVERRERARTAEANAAQLATSAGGAPSTPTRGGGGGGRASTTSTPRPTHVRTPTAPALSSFSTPELKRSGSTSSVTTPRSTSKSRAAAAATSASSSDSATAAAATPVRRSTSNKKKSKTSSTPDHNNAVASFPSPSPTTPRGRSRQSGSSATPQDASASSAFASGGRTGRSRASDGSRAPRCASASPSRYKVQVEEEDPHEAQARRRAAVLRQDRPYTPREGSRLLQPGRLARASAEINLGPADYDTPQSTLSARTTLLRGKPEPDVFVQKRAAIPGPGSYSPPHSTLSPRGPALRGKNDLDLHAASLAKHPGPGAYSPPESTLSPRSTTLRGKTDLDLVAQSRALVPGPGSYSPAQSSLASRGPTLHTPSEDAEMAQAASQARAAQLPGPGAYEIDSGFATMQALPGQKAYGPTPTTPPSHSPRGQHQRSGSAPSFARPSSIPGPSLKARHVDHSLARAAQLPAPNSYDLASTLGTGAPAAALRSRLPVLPSSNLASPPPGAYDAAAASDMGAPSPRDTKGPFVRGKSLDFMAPRPSTSVGVAAEQAIIMSKYKATERTQ